MKRKTAGRSAKPRECFSCHGGIPEQKPVYLIHISSGNLVGPFHSGCAWKLREELRQMGSAVPGVLELADVYGKAPREETLPW